MENQRRYPNRSPLTPEARQAQQNLYRLWRIYRSEHGWRQADLAKELGIGQAAVSQYLNGELSLNPKIVLELARILGVHPDEIWPGLVPAVQSIEDALPPDAMVFAREFARLSLRNRRVIQEVIDNFSAAQRVE